MSDVPGNVKTITFTTPNKAGILTNPTAVTIQVKTPTMVRLKQDPMVYVWGSSAIQNPSPGTFTLDVSETEGGNWWTRGEATGTVEVAAETTWYVDPGKFGSNNAGGGTAGVPAPYILPVASNTTLGGVKVGSGLSINGTGLLTVTGGAVSDATTSAVGTVLVDHAPSGAHPVALTTDSTIMPAGMLGAHTWTGAQSGPFFDNGGSLFNVKHPTYGATGDGTTDDSVAIQAAISAAYAAGGGVVFFPAGTYRVNRQLYLPNDGASTPSQKSMHLRGAGPSHNGQGGSPLGGTILDLRYDGTTGAQFLGTYAVVTGFGVTFGASTLTVASGTAYMGNATTVAAPSAITPTAGSLSISGLANGTYWLDVDASGNVYATTNMQGTDTRVSASSTAYTLTTGAPADSGKGVSTAPNTLRIAMVVVATNAIVVSTSVSGNAISKDARDFIPKIDTRGLGYLEIEGITFYNGGTDTLPFIQTTNTTVHIERCQFQGNKTRSGTGCLQDAIVLGGRGYASPSSGSALDKEFQGYGTVISRCYFGNIRTGVAANTSANSIRIRENVWWITCGGDATHAAVEVCDFVNTGSANAGIGIKDNLFEVGNYPYAVRLSNVLNVSMSGNDFWDETVTTLAFVRWEADARYSLFIHDGYGKNTTAAFSEASGGSTNSLLTGGNNVNMRLNGGGNLTSKGNGTFGFVFTDNVQTNSGNGVTVAAQTAANTGLSVKGTASQTGDLFVLKDSGNNKQFAVANIGSGASPVWALRARAIANAESMAQSHTITGYTGGGYSGRSIQVIDDAGATLGWLPLMN